MNLDQVKFAQKLVISLVKSPLYTQNPLHPYHQPNLDTELTEYFQTTRTFHVNDYFHIRGLLKPNVYYKFKVVQVEPVDLVEFKVNNQKTSLTQAGSIEDKWTWLSKNNNEILKSYVNEIDKVIKFNELFYSDNQVPLLLIHGPSGSGKTSCVQYACEQLEFHLIKVNCVNLAGESASAVEKRVDIFIQNSINYGPCILLFKSFHFLFKLKDINEFNKRVINSFFNSINSIRTRTKNKILVICTTSTKQSLNSDILSKFNQEIEIKNLNDDQRRDFLKQELKIDEETMLNLIKKTTGLFYGELKTLCDLINLNQSQSINETCEKFQSNRKFQQENKLKIDSIKWSDVGGLSNIKDIITDTIILPLKYPALFTSTNNQLGITRSGILLYGPPGTGKTLLAKAISNECGLNFLSVKGPELLDMYVGQTEQNVRNLFEKARVNSPCILFFDELDSLAPVRGRAGDSGGVMDRVVSQLLTEIDGLDKLNSDDKLNQIFLIGATNRPDLIDQSLLRPGRFDKLVYVPIAKEFDERFKIFEALVRKLPVDPDFDKEKFVKEKCPVNLSGADFYAITNKARQNAIKRIISNVDTNENINEQDFERALDGFNANLSDQELLVYENYFNRFSNKQ